MAEITANLLYNIGSCYFGLKQYQKSQLFFNEALTINQKYTKALYKRAMSRYEMSKFDNALTDIKTAYNLEKSN